MPAYFTKSRFREALECPTRTHYATQAAYGSTAVEDPFLRILADGGYQVNALAQRQYPEGVLVAELDTDTALERTRALLRQERITIFEAAFVAGSLLIRADIVVKRGDTVSLIEVKAKSFDSRNPDLLGKRGKVSAKWQPYVADVAFQRLVMERAYPHWRIEPYLMLVDKSRRCDIDGLHQRFVLQRRGKRTSVRYVGGDDEDLGTKLLSLAPVSREIDALPRLLPASQSFADDVDTLAQAFVARSKFAPTLGVKCRRCPYRIDATLRAAGKRSGFDACWQEVTGLSQQALQRPLVVDMGSLPVESLIEAGVYQLADVPESTLRVKANDASGLSRSERRWLQVQKLRDDDSRSYCDLYGLRDVFSGFHYPLHMIDFETISPAIPFYKGSRPYGQVAFQFSHHTLDADGTVTHQHQYLDIRQGQFPSFDFARALKAALEPYDGTIFRFAPHENTVLGDIIDQLQDLEVPPADRDSLCTWLKSITHAGQKKEEQWVGARDMIDAWDLVKRFYFHPMMGSSTSLKYVLPAVLSDSAFLQAKYGAPIYGAQGGIKSHNFVDWQWIRRDAAGHVTDPYRLLPQIFSPADEDEIDRIFAEGEVRNGGAAMMAFAKMQFVAMQQTERDQLRDALLKYCELDTLAMVMLFEHWRSLLHL